MGKTESSSSSRKAPRVTPRFIRGLACPADKKQVYECLQPDAYLYVSVARGGTKSFVYRRKLNGTYRELHLGKFADSLDDALARESIREAVTRASELTVKILRGENPFDAAKIRHAQPTFRELFEEYLERHAKKSRKTAADMEKNFDRWMVSLASRKASAILHTDVEKLHAALGKRAPYAANRAIQLGRAVYYKAIEWKLYSGDNPFAGITLFDEHPRDRFLSAGEAARLIKALRELPLVDDHMRALRDFILLDIFTGVRKSNLLSMTWSEIDLKAGTWTIPDWKLKNKTGQVIPLGPTEIEILEERESFLRSHAKKHGISPFVFPGTGKTGHLMDVHRSWTTLRKQTKLEDITIHDLRRSLAATMASQNVNVALIKGALNHKDMKTTLNVYARTTKQAELEAKQLAHNVWFKAVEELPEPDEVSPEQDKVTPIKKKRA